MFITWGASFRIPPPIEPVVAGSQESASGGDEERTVGAAANCRNFNPFLPHGERGREGHSLRGGVAVMATQTQLTCMSTITAVGETKTLQSSRFDTHLCSQLSTFSGQG